MTKERRKRRPVAATPAVETLSGRKPRIMIAGEFSAGKTRLISGLVGEEVLPSNVTATALPPVWLVYGAKALAAVDQDGKLRKVETLADVTLENTKFCVISHPAKLLKEVDIIDTPGSSDPNIPAESWEHMLGYVDHIVWCTNATQAWRQSEKSTWNEFPETLVGDATLLVTHADRMPDGRTADRVMRRVQREAKAYFKNYLMASLIRPLDVEKVSKHISKLVSAGLELTSNENSLIAQFAEDRAAEAIVSRPATARRARVRPSRVSKARAPKGKPVNSDLKPANVLVLDRSPGKPTEVHEQSAFRAAWNGLLAGCDTSDAKDVLNRVERFLTHLENEAFLAHPEKPDVEAGKVDQLVKSIAYGVQP